MLRRTGSREPLVVVFVALCTGIFFCLHDLFPLAFSLLLVFFLASKKQYMYVFVGVFAGIVSVMVVPDWAGIEPGMHDISGKVKEARFNRGTYSMVLGDLLVDQKKTRGHAQINVYNHVKPLQRGTRLEARAKVTPVHAFGNKGEFDYQRYLLSQGITVKGYVKGFDAIRYISMPDKVCPISRLRKQVSSRLSSMARPEAEILKAILLGDRSGLVYCLRDRFSALGMSHLMAVSGLHIGIVILFGYTLCFSVLRIIPFFALRLDTPLVSTLFGVVLAILYAMLVGPYVSVIRSVIMAVCLVLSLVLGRGAGLLTSLAIAGIIILVLFPYDIYSPGFILSFSAVFGIIAVMSRLRGRPAWIKFMVVPLAACGFTMPFVSQVFGFVSPLGLVCNLLFVPVFGITVMPPALLGLAVFGVCPGLAMHLFSIAMDTIGLISFLGETAGVLVPVAGQWPVWIFCLYLTLILAFFSDHSHPWILGGLCVLLLCLPLARFVIYKNGPLTFDFISVGQGDSAIITRKGHAILIDAGGSIKGFDTGRFIVVPRLLNKGITRLDLVVVTHSDIDHIGGMPFVADRLRVDRIWTNMAKDYNPYFREIKRIAACKAIPVKHVSLGDCLDLDGLSIEVLNPLTKIEKRQRKMNLNFNSMVLMIKDKGMKGLFMADADANAELNLAHLDRQIPADILKVSHHGSRQSCYDVLLDRVSPETAVISCGYNNWFNLPSKACLQRLKDHHIPVYRTDLDGEIIVREVNGKREITQGLNIRDKGD